LYRSIRFDWFTTESQQLAAPGFDCFNNLNPRCSSSRSDQRSSGSGPGSTT
jgi:hypothetical protein